MSLGNNFAFCFDICRTVFEEMSIILSSPFWENVAIFVPWLFTAKLTIYSLSLFIVDLLSLFLILLSACWGRRFGHLGYKRRRVCLELGQFFLLCRWVCSWTSFWGRLRSLKDFWVQAILWVTWLLYFYVFCFSWVIFRWVWFCGCPSFQQSINYS